MTDEMQLTPEARKAEDAWRKQHGHDCPCWKCMHVTARWVEMCDQAQREAERSEAEIEKLRAEVAEGAKAFLREHELSEQLRDEVERLRVANEGLERIAMGKNTRAETAEAALQRIADVPCDWKRDNCACESCIAYDALPSAGKKEGE